MKTALSKPQNTILSDLLKILVVDTLWVIFVIGLTGLISILLHTLLQKWIDERDIAAIGYLFGALLTGAIVWLKIRPWLLPIGGLYMGGLVLMLRLHLPSDFPNIWGLIIPSGGLIEFLPPNAWTVLFCFNAVMIQLMGCGAVWLYRQVYNRIKTDRMSPNGFGFAHGGFKWLLRMIIGQFIWFGIGSAPSMSFILPYATVFTRAPKWLCWSAPWLFIVIIAGFLFPMVLRSWKEFGISIPATIILGCAIPFISPLKELFGIASMLKWMDYDFSPVVNAVMNIGITIALEALSLLAWRAVLRISKGTK